MILFCIYSKIDGSECSSNWKNVKGDDILKLHVKVYPSLS